ncbi:GGDEF domain-containing protein [Parasphingorhabdus cellanae]|uniref:diguanylate cyclase n=1 Tax=Parasphingorhabdus cellanae TaxID=2806553 RepID=A0ABX7T582_9SPHN|nr:GGDEF domain-containing protein [Parasphingorhabdus cellanae]QTD56740.1 GGDEF domain-containing protein [Parasphingorhabdus cellanae]
MANAAYQDSYTVSPDIPDIGKDEVARKLMLDGLERRIAGQLSVIIPVAVIGWIASLTDNRALWMFLGLQIVAQLAIAGTSQWLRRAVEAGKSAAIRKSLWMVAEASSGIIWAAMMLDVGTLIGGSDAVLTTWVTILVTMVVSVLLAAPIAGIAFPLLGGFTAAVVAGIWLFGKDFSSFAELALAFMCIALFIIAKAVNLQAHKSCHDGIEVERLSQRLAEELRRTSWLSQHDRMTGLLNRSALHERIAELGNIPTPLILLDIDHFKQVNDSYGHGQGDEVIAAVSACIRETLDKTAPDALAARWGGEEFIIALPDCNAPDHQADAAEIAETLRSAVAKLTHPDWPARLRVTGSLGVAYGPASAFSAMFKSADSAMYDAKEQGRNRVVCADDRNGKVIKPARAA